MVIARSIKRRLEIKSSKTRKEVRDMEIEKSELERIIEKIDENPQDAKKELVALVKLAPINPSLKEIRQMKNFIE